MEKHGGAGELSVKSKWHHNLINISNTWGFLMRQKIMLCFVGIVVIFSAGSCTTTKAHKQEKLSKSSAEAYYLSDSDLALNKKMALKGDAEAAFKVACYYSMVPGKDRFTGIGWLLLAANNGYVDAQTLLGSFHMKGNFLENLDLAEYWYKKAAKNGSKGAKSVLKEIEQSKKDQVND